MVWFPDILIEYRGMSIVTALFFTGLFVLIGIEWMHVSDRFKRLEARIDSGKEQQKETEKYLNVINVELAIIKTTLFRVDLSLEKLVDQNQGKK